MLQACPWITNCHVDYDSFEEEKVFESIDKMLKVDDVPIETPTFSSQIGSKEVITH